MSCPATHIMCCMVWRFDSGTVLEPIQNSRVGLVLLIVAKRFATEHTHTRELSSLLWRSLFFSSRISIVAPCAGTVLGPKQKAFVKNVPGNQMKKSSHARSRNEIILCCYWRDGSVFLKQRSHPIENRQCRGLHMTGEELVSPFPCMRFCANEFPTNEDRKSEVDSSLIEWEAQYLHLICTTMFSVRF